MIKSLKLLILFAILSGTATVRAQDQIADFDTNFVHVVYFYLNNPEDPQDRTDFETSLKKLMDNSLYAKTKFIGIPAETPRGVVDNSYTYSLILTFPSREMQDNYQEEAAHLLFIEEAAHLWNKVIVYDSVGID